MRIAFFLKNPIQFNIVYILLLDFPFLSLKCLKTEIESLQKTLQIRYSQYKTFKRCPGHLLNSYLRSIYVLCPGGRQCNDLQRSIDKV